MSIAATKMMLRMYLRTAWQWGQVSGSTFQIFKPPARAGRALGAFLHLG